MIPKIFCALTIVLTASTSLGYVAGLGWFPSLFVHFPVQLGMMAFIATGVHLATRRRKWALIAGLSAVLNATRVLPWWFGAPSDVDGGPKLRVMSLNLLEDNAATTQVLEFIRTEHPDLLVVQEADAGWQSRLEPSLAVEYPHRHFLGGIGILSRHPFDDVHLIEVTPDDRPVLVRFTWHSPGGLVRILAAHLHTPRAKSYSKRVREVAELRRQMSGIDHPAMVLGDLNLTPWDPMYSDLMVGTGWVDARRGRGILPTRRHTTNPLLRGWLKPLGLIAAVPIDYVLSTPDLIVTSLRTGSDVGSDHLPLVAEFRRPEHALLAP